jgi:hypothetical protein
MQCTAVEEELRYNEAAMVPFEEQTDREEHLMDD